MDKLKIVVCGTIKNGAKTIEKNINGLLEIQKYCLDFKMILYENDSTDGTTEILNKMKFYHPLMHQNF